MPHHTLNKTDHKNRFGGILENPYISKIQRHCLDGFKVKKLADILKPFAFTNLLDVGCGLGEYSHLKKGKYVGIDNSFLRISFAQKQYKNFFFIQGNAMQLPFKNNSFEATLLANTAHHLSDQEFQQVLEELKRVSQKYIIIEDCVRILNQSWLSQFFYSLDRGTKFRTVEEFEGHFRRIKNLEMILKTTHGTFPGIYLHGIFVFKLNK